MKRLLRTLFIISVAALVLQNGRVLRAQPGPEVVKKPTFADRTYNVMDFGATGKGEMNDTPTIDKAIAKLNADGGGTLKFPAGTYLVASIHLKSNIRFELDKDAIIMGAKDGFDLPEPNEKNDKYQDFGHSHFHNAVMWGENIENFAIVGGTINGGGIINGDPKPGGGDKQISIVKGKKLLFDGVTHIKGGHFVYLLNDCEDITIANDIVKGSRDVIDIMGCRNVQVYNCNYTGCGDDTLGIKSDYALGRKINSENIFAWDCYFETGCNGVQFGSETAGDFKNIHCWNIKIGRAGKAGIGITCNDGAIIDSVNFHDFIIKEAVNPIFINVTTRLRTGEPGKKVGQIKNVRIANVISTEPKITRNAREATPTASANPATISGREDSYIENLVLENIKLEYPGGGTRDQADVVPPYLTTKYTPRDMGIRPASGFYIRHVKGLKMKNVEVTFLKEDQRPPVVALDVQGWILENFKTQKPEGIETMRLEQIKDLELRNCQGLKDEKIPAIEKSNK